MRTTVTLDVTADEVHAHHVNVYPPEDGGLSSTSVQTYLDFGGVEVVFHEADLAAVPTMLRRLADELEALEFTDEDGALRGWPAVTLSQAVTA